MDNSNRLEQIAVSGCRLIGKGKGLAAWEKKGGSDGQTGVQEVEWAVGRGWQHAWEKNGGIDGQVGVQVGRVAGERRKRQLGC